MNGDALDYGSVGSGVGGCGDASGDDYGDNGYVGLCGGAADGDNADNSDEVVCWLLNVPETG